MSKKQDPELLKEFMNFGTLFGLNFLQDIFGNQPEGVDEKYDEWKEQQADLAPIMDKWQEMEDKKMSPKEKQKAMAAHNDKLAKAMNAMPPALQGKALEQFQVGAARTYLQAQEALVTMLGNIGGAAEKIDTIAPFNKLEAAEVKKAKAIVVKGTATAVKQAVSVWKMLLDSMVELKKEKPQGISDKVYRQIDPEGFEKKISAKFDQFLKESVVFEAEGDDKETVQEIAKTFKEITEKPITDLKSGLNVLITNYMQDENSPNPFGIQPSTARQWMQKVEEALDRLFRAVTVDVPNQLASELNLGSVSAISADATQDAYKEIAELDPKDTDGLKKLLEKIYDGGGQPALQKINAKAHAKFKDLKPADEEDRLKAKKAYNIIAYKDKNNERTKKLANDYSEWSAEIKNWSGLQESVVLERKFRKIFYEHFGDFS